MALLAVAAYAMFSSRQASARIQKQGSSPFLGQFPMEVAYWLLEPIGRLAVSLRLSPDVFSWSCLALGMASGVAAGLGAVPTAGGLALASAVFDAMDGIVARSRGVDSAAGEVLDSAIDRYAEFFFLAGLGVYYRGELWALLLVQAAILGSMLVSYSQAKGEAMGVELPRGWMRRPERALYLGGSAVLSPIVTGPWEAGGPAPLHYPVLAALCLVAVFANATALRRFVVLCRTLSARSPHPQRTQRS
jgi:CDP-diacylglycerol--glycerol-3-phosphate 3-phosphatidyltransferase